MPKAPEERLGAVEAGEVRGLEVDLRERVGRGDFGLGRGFVLAAAHDCDHELLVGEVELPDRGLRGLEGLQEVDGGGVVG